MKAEKVRADPTTWMARENVRFFQERYRLTDAAVQSAGGLKGTSLYDFRTTNSRIDTLGKIAKGLGVPPSVLLLPLDKRDALVLMLDTLRTAEPADGQRLSEMLRAFLEVTEVFSIPPPKHESDTP